MMSNVTRDDVEKMIEAAVSRAIETSIPKFVNGKIDALRDEMKPMLTTFSNLNWGRRVLIGTGIFLAGVAGFILTVIEIIKFISTSHK